MSEEIDFKPVVRSGDDTLRGTYINTMTIRLDLYRLRCIFEASQAMASQCMDEIGCPVRELLDDFEDYEITHLLVSTAVFGRFIQEQHWKKGGKYERWNQFFSHRVGELIKNTRTPSEPVDLTLRESFNKIVHANQIVPVEAPGQPHYQRYLLPIVRLYGESQSERPWEATLDVREYTNLLQQLIGLFG